MLDFVEGTCIEKKEASVVLAVGGIGLEILLPLSALSKIVLGEKTTLFTHLHYTEKDLRLFGFLQKEARAFFLKLSQVNGVGPRKALLLLRNDVKRIARWIEEGDVIALSTTPGIGKKLGSRIVLELRGKLSEKTPASPQVKIVREALKKLGFAPAEIQEALQTIRWEKEAKSEDRIKQALQTLQSLSRP